MGYHVRPGDIVLETYSRDALAQPLRVLVRLLGQITAGTFVPDGTRSGYFPAPPPSTTSPASTCSVSTATTGNDNGDDDPGDLEGIASELDDVLLQEPACVFVKNVRTGYFHVRDGSLRLRCGKCAPVALEEHTALPEGALMCQRCF